jgi:hypothetical protein
MQIRRFTRLTDGHSKKWENHEAAVSLFVAYYNYCRPHMTLTKRSAPRGEPRTLTTPAMAAGLSDHVWSMAELLAAVGVPCWSTSGVMLSNPADNEWKNVDDAILAGRVQLAFLSLTEITGGNPEEVTQLLRARLNKLQLDWPERFTEDVKDCWKVF